MAKFGVGVGEEFPVDEPSKKDAPAETAGPGRGCGWRADWGRLGWLHVTLAVLLRVAIIGLLIAVAWSLFHPYPYAYRPYGYHPYSHHFFFPFFPLLLIVLFAFAWRGGRYRRWRRWHDETHGRGPHEEA
jgi:hypothetical protein